MGDIHEMAMKFMSVRTNIKFYHWRTSFFAAHKSSDEFLSKFDENIDKIVEYIQGSRGTRVILSNCSEGFELYDVNDTNIVAYLNHFKLWLTTIFTKSLDSKTDVDILALRDEVVGDINQFIYLLSFS